MSDSSPRSSVSDSGRCSSPTVAGGLAFLVHSPETVQRDLPPDVDNKPLARQKRRRTRYARIFYCVLWLVRVTTRCYVAVLHDQSCVCYTNPTPPLTTMTPNSKEDEDILKAEYQRNPKPDKAARLEIVRRVALGEKEVQVCIPSFTTYVVPND